MVGQNGASLRSLQSTESWFNEAPNRATPVASRLHDRNCDSTTIFQPPPRLSRYGAQIRLPSEVVLAKDLTRQGFDSRRIRLISCSPSHSFQVPRKNANFRHRSAAESYDELQATVPTSKSRIINRVLSFRSFLTKTTYLHSSDTFVTLIPTPDAFRFRNRDRNGLVSTI